MINISSQKNILYNLRRFLIKTRTKLFFLALVVSKKYRNYIFTNYLFKENQHFKKFDHTKKNLIIIWEKKFEYLNLKIKEDEKINLIIIPRIFFNTGFNFLLRRYHKKKSKLTPGHYDTYFYRSNIFRADRYKFRKYCKEILEFINSHARIDLILMPKCNDDWTIDFIEVINEEKYKLLIDDREGAVTPQRLLKVPPQYLDLDLNFDLMTTQNNLHKKFFIKSGFPESKIIVNGVIQSDYWFNKKFWKDLSEIKVSLREDLIKILFFSFGERTYMNFYYGDEKRTWLPLIIDVNDVLIEILNKYEGKIQVLYKTSVKFKRDTSDDVNRLIEATQKHIENGYLLFLDGSISTNDLIRFSKIVIGFQTSGMVEAMYTSNQIIYTAWGEFYNEIKKTLLPLENEKCLDICSSKEIFFNTLEKAIVRESNGKKYNDFSIKERKKFIDQYFAFSDGKVTERLANIIYEMI